MNPSDHTPLSTPDTSMLFIQSIKGAPASVLLALAFTGRFMSHQELQLWTRCGKDQVSFAIKTLTASGWIAGRSTRGPWSLAHSLPIPAGNPFQERNPLKGLGSSGDSLNPSTGDSLLLSPFRKELLDSLYAFGIREPTASELAELPHMNLKYLQAHLAAARSHGLRVGAAIQAMRLGAPPPDQLVKRDRQSEVEAKIRRFIEGA